MRVLIIAEKSNAARRIATILSDGKSKKINIGGIPVFVFSKNNNEYSVVGLRGHIVKLDYPKEMNDWSKVDLKKLIFTPPIKKVTAGKLINAIRELAGRSDEVIIATDYDREGELIGLETVRVIGIDMNRVKRAKFSALTKQEIEKAFSNLVTPDERLAASAESRQIIDLAWGASLTRLISLASGQIGNNFLSVGRVQSPTLSLIVNRHREIENFIPEPYWIIKARFKNSQEFNGDHSKNPFWEKDKASEIMQKLENEKEGIVEKYEIEERMEYPPPPFNTTAMLAEASKIGLSPAKAMKVAEDLYTDGYISYPRTDNTVYPGSLSLKRILEQLKQSEFAKEAKELLSQPSIRASRGKVQTTDHPPIHPVSAATKQKLRGERWALYELIVRRFLATVAPPSKIEERTCHVSVNGEIFIAKGSQVKELGWRKYYTYWKVRETELPILTEGEKVKVVSVDLEEKKTKPPSRYTQGKLIQEMERLGLGTKSTRHEIIQKLYERKYVEGSDLVPTATGIAVVESLEKHARMITESEMTAALERDMDRISTGETTLEEVVRESQEMLSEILGVMQKHKEQIGNEIRKALQEQQFIGKCPKCGNDLRIIRTKKGSFIGCSGYPECTEAYPIPRSAKVEITDEKCDKCGLPKIKVIRKGQPVSIQCIDPKCESNLNKNTLGKCPRCGGELRIIYSRNGKRFVGCSGYPECSQTYPLYQRGHIIPTNKQCPSCGLPMIKIKNGKRETEICIDPECSGKAKAKVVDQ